jgi:hypothetical protein
METTDFESRKKELEFWRRSENGWQFWKTVLRRKLAKKAGQLGDVKFAPKLVSKGWGKLPRKVGVGAVWMEVADAPTDANAAVVDGGFDAAALLRIELGDAELGDAELGAVELGEESESLGAPPLS